MTSKEIEELAGHRQVSAWVVKLVSDAVAAQKKEWVGLTDEEILEEYRQSYGDDGNLTDVYFARAIEAKLKEKNT
jgi:hypothetical protein